MLSKDTKCQGFYGLPESRIQMSIDTVPVMFIWWLAIVLSAFGLRSRYNPFHIHLAIRISIPESVNWKNHPKNKENMKWTVYTYRWFTVNYK